MKEFSLKWAKIKRKGGFLTGALLLLTFLLVMPVSGAGELTAERKFSETSVEPGGTFQVSVLVTASQEVVAPALDEDLPENWDLNQVEDAGAVFKPSTFEWIWVESFAAGESRKVVYEVKVPVNASEGIYQLSGSVSAFNVSLSPVQGEKEVFVSEGGGEPPEDGILLYSGWNFISVPYALKNASVEKVLEGVDYTSLVYYNTGSGSWDVPENFEPLKAYWLLVNSTDTQNIALDKLEKKPVSGPELPASLKVYEGWNTVGYTDSVDSLSAELALISIDGIYTSVLGPWDPINETYLYSGHNGESGIISGKHIGTDVFEMKAYEGYWVYATGNGSLAAVWV